MASASAASGTVSRSRGMAGLLRRARRRRAGESDRGGGQQCRRRPLASELPVGDNERGLAIGHGPQACGEGAVTLVLGAVGPQRAESGGVAAALGREMTTEAEHVRPGSQAQAAEGGEPAEPQAFGNKAASVLADGKIGQPVGGGGPGGQGGGVRGGSGGIWEKGGGGGRGRERSPSRSAGVIRRSRVPVHSAALVA